MKPLTFILTLAVAALPATSSLTHAADESHFITDHAVCAPEGVALGGYDLVSYFVDGPVMGSPAFALEHNSLTYHFVSEENQERFAASPDSYLPKYRGWCSATLSMGRLACPDFTNYKIEDGQLLLFERIGFSNGLDMWNANPVTAGKNADTHYRRLLQEARSHKPK